MASIRDVAKLAGVSTATVSRVINGSAVVSEEKCERVRKAIEMTNFKPNALANMLFSGQTHLIGMVVPDIQNPFFAAMAKVIENALSEEGYQLILCSSDDNPEKQIQSINMLAGIKADGIILLTSADEVDEHVRTINIPMVVLDREVNLPNQIACIHSDNTDGGRQAAEYLIQLGCEKIVCVRGPEEISSARERYLGFDQVMKQHEKDYQTVDSMYGYEDGLSAGEMILQNYPQTDAVFCCNDLNALGVYKILNRSGKRIPEDIKLIGFDDIRLASHMSPELTTIRQDVKGLAGLAVDLLLRYLRQEPIEKVNILPVQLVVRETA